MVSVGDVASISAAREGLAERRRIQRLAAAQKFKGRSRKSTLICTQVSNLLKYAATMSFGTTSFRLRVETSAVSTPHTSDRDHEKNDVWSRMGGSLDCEEWLSSCSSTSRPTVTTSTAPIALQREIIARTAHEQV